MSERFTEKYDGWLTIEELANASQLTVRNIRAHQSRGTLPKPHMKGRKGFYDAAHLARLEKITSLQNRGYSLAAIKDLLTHKDPAEIETEVLAALDGWEGDLPSEMSLEEFRQRYGFLLENERLIQKAVEAGLILFHGDRVGFPMPALVDVAAALQEHGADNALLPFVELAERTNERLQSVARDVVETFIKGVMWSTEDMDVSQLVATFRPLGLATISSLFSHAIAKEITALLENKLEEKHPR